MPKKSRSKESGQYAEESGRSDRRDSQARRSGRSRRGQQRRISVRGELRDTPDVRKIARAVIAMAVAQAEADAAASHHTSPESPDA